MSIKLCQATGSTVTPLDDARLYSWIANRAVGIVTGCTVTSAGTNQLSIAAGWGVCQGHMFTISAETIGAVLATSGTLPGRLLIHIDTADTDMPVKFVTQAASTLPALTQEDIDGSGSIYEIPLATYTAGTISISDLTSAAPAAPSLQSEIDSLNASYATLNQKSAAVSAINYASGNINLGKSGHIVECQITGVVVNQTLPVGTWYPIGTIPAGFRAAYDVYKTLLASSKQYTLWIATSGVISLKPVSAAGASGDGFYDCFSWIV